MFRVGDATTPAGTSAAAPVYLDEYTTSGTLVQSISLPSSTASGMALTDSGKASSDGMLTLSPDGSQIALFGYNVAAGTASATSAATETAGIVGADGTIQLASFSDETGQNARSAVYDPATGRLYTSGGRGLFESSFTAGGTPTTTAIVSGNTGDVQIVGGVVFYTSGTSILSLGGEPTTATAGTVVVSDGAGNSPTQFFFARLGTGSTFGTTGADTLYVADSKAANGTLFKYSWNGSAWTAAGSITGPDTAAGNQILGVTGTVSGPASSLTGTIYFSEGNTSSTTVGDVFKFTDTFSATISNATSAPARVVNVTAQQNFRGLVLAPDDGVAAIGGLAGTTPYTAGSAATAIGPAATFSDASNFMGGSLTATIATGGAAADMLGLAAGNTITFTGTTSGNVSYSGNLIGTYTLSAGVSSTLTVSFNPVGPETVGNTAANPVSSAAIQALIQQVTFKTTGASGNRSVSFQVTENGGTSGVPATQTVNVASHVPPAVAANTGLTVPQSSTTTITSSNLSYTSSTDSAAQLTYSITAGPTGGTLTKSGNPTTSFTQADINSGLISYVQNGSDTTSDSFSFTVTDAESAQASGSFAVTIAAPVLVNNVSTLVQAASSVTLGTSVLETTETGKTSSQLIYTIGTAPASGTLTNTHTHVTLSAGSTFTQADVDSGFISYTNTNVSAAADSFKFTVTDGGSGSTGSKTFALTVNHAPAVAHDAGLSVNPGQGATLTTSLLDVTDIEQAASALTYTIGTAPTAGTLFNNGTALAAGSTFTQANIDSGKIYYVSSGSTTVGDSFTFTVSDGVGGVLGSTPFALNVMLPSTVSYGGGSYSQNFGGLPSTGTYTLHTAGPMSLDTSSVPTSGLAGWSMAQYAGTTLNTEKFAVDTGSGTTTGSVYSYGNFAGDAANAGNLALGLIGTGSNASEFGLTLVNTSGVTLNQFSLSYKGEQWLENKNPNTLTFGYALGAASIADGLATFLSDSNLNYTGTQTTASATGLDGQLAANQSNLSDTIGGLNWAPGQTLVLRWSIAGSGNSAGAAIDDLSFTAQAMPTVTLAAATQSVGENGGTFTVTVNLSAASGVATTVPFTIGGTAASGVNYSGVTASPLVIPAGMTSGTITGMLIDDGKFEPTSTTLTVTLGTPTNATLGAITSDTVTIVQRDPEPTVSLALATQSVNENGGTFTVTVNLSAASGVATTVPFTIGGTAASGVNYSGVTASPLVIPAGMTSGTITGMLIDDGKFEPTSTTLTVTLGTPTNATLGAITSDTVTIVQSDPEPTVSLALATQSVNENGGTFTVTVNLSAASGVATTVRFTNGGTAPSGVTDSGVTASPLVIPAGQTSSTITGTLIDDGKFEPTNSTLTVSLGTPTNATLGATTSDTVTIVQSDPEPTVSLALATQSVNENGGTFTVTVNLSAASGVATTVPFTIGGTAASGVNYSGVTASPLVIPAGQTIGTITGTLIDDGKFESTNTTLSVTLGTPTNATLGAVTSDTVTIVQSDPEPTISLAAATQSVNENGGTFTVTVNLSAASGVTTTVPFTLGGTAVSGVNYSGVTASPLVIPAGMTSGTITGTLIDDGKFEPTNTTLTVTLGTPTNATLGAVTSDTVTIVQSDPEPTVALALATQSVNENGGTFTVTVNLSAASGVATTVPFTLGGTAASGVNYSGVTASPLVIPAGQTSGTITGTLIDDGKFESTNTTLTVTLGTPTNATLGAITSDTVTIVESDGVPTVSLVAATQSTGENGGTFTVTVNLSAASGLATTVPFSLGGTAVNGVNYFGASASPLVIPAGQTSGSITVTAIDDGKYSPTNATLIVTLGTPTNASLGAITSDTVTIVQSDPEPTVSLATATQSVGENGGSFTVTVNLSAASDVTTTVPFTLGGTAASGVNYSGVTASPLVIPAGMTSGTITGTLIDDGKFEPTNTTLTVTLGTPTNATLGATTADTVTIVQSDPEPTVSLAAATQSINENGGSFTVTVNLSAASSLATTVPFTLGGTAVSGVNYSNVTASPLVIPAGQTSGTITGTLIDDGKFEPTNITLTVTLGTPTNATLGPITTDTVTIVQSDPEPTVSLAAATQSVNENGGTFTVTVNLSAASGVATTVPFTLGGTAVSGVNYSNVTASPLVIPAGMTSGTITGTLIDDGHFDATNNTLTVTLGTPVNATLGATAAETITIVESDSPLSAAISPAASPRNTPVDSMTITFSAPVSGFSLANLQLSQDGGPNLLSGAQTLTSADNMTWTLGNLTGLTGANGNYVLSLSAAGIQDAGDNTLPSDLTSSFTVNATVPTVAITPISPNPRNSAVDAMTITFSEPVNGFSLANLQLSLAGGPNLLTAAQTLTSADNTTWMLGNLAALTAGSGNYSLTLSPGGIEDVVGNALAAGAVSTFTLHTWQNAANRLDVNVDHAITPIDALDVIDFLNLHGDSVLPATFSGTKYLDVNGDNQVTPLDALAIIDYLNLHGPTPAVVSAVASPAIAVMSTGPLSTGLLAVTASSPTIPALAVQAPSTESHSTGPVDAAITWAVSASPANQPAIGSTASIVASGPASADSAFSAAPTANSVRLSQTAVDTYFANGARRKADATVEPAAADIILAGLPD